MKNSLGFLTIVLMSVSLVCVVFMGAITKTKSDFHPIPKNNQMMTCQADQWEKAPNGGIRITYLICKDRQNVTSLWHRVPDHQTSLRTGEKLEPWAMSGEKPSIALPAMKVETKPVIDVDEYDEDLEPETRPK